ncbi:DUF354 domain-containing protein [bacterium]|nr:DUF354 domain-containing protein [bacterium]
MKVLIDICHPAHFHFFKHPISELKARGHEVILTSRGKDCATVLIEDAGLEHYCLGDEHSGGVFGMARELVVRDVQLARFVRQQRPEVLAAVGGVFVAHAGRLTGTPSVVFYDTELARMQNALTYPFANCVAVPDCYFASVPKTRTVRYSGFHELSYLHPDRFVPDREIAERSGLDSKRQNSLVRVVSWTANHDVGQSGWSQATLSAVVQHLAQLGHVMVSSEVQLPNEIEQYRYQGNPGDMHHVLAFCSACVGESATVASEAAMLGVPALYVSDARRGYIDALDDRYGLVIRVPGSSSSAQILDAIDRMLTLPLDSRKRRHQAMLVEMCNVSKFAADLIVSSAKLRWRAP